MSAAKTSSWQRIKSKSLGVVKPQVLRFALRATLIVHLCSWSAFGSPAPSAIGARSYSASIVQTSRSGKSFMLEAVGADRPKVGKIILLRRNGAPVAAMRVLKTYDGKANRFAAAQIKAYSGIRIGQGESFDVVERERGSAPSTGPSISAPVASAPPAPIVSAPPAPVENIPVTIASDSSDIAAEPVPLAPSPATNLAMSSVSSQAQSLIPRTDEPVAPPPLPEPSAENLNGIVPPAQAQDQPLAQPPAEPLTQPLAQPIPQNSAQTLAMNSASDPTALPLPAPPNDGNSPPADLAMEPAPTAPIPTDQGAISSNPDPAQIPPELAAAKSGESAVEDLPPPPPPDDGTLVADATPPPPPIEPGSAVAAANTAPDLGSASEPEAPPVQDIPDDAASAPPLESGSSSDSRSKSESDFSDDTGSNRSFDEDGDDTDEISVEEVNSFDPYWQWLTVSMGLFRNSGPPDGAAASYFAGGGIRYGLSLLRMLFFRSNSVQDSLVLEGGLFFYRVVNFVELGDSFTLLPIIGTLRYNLLFSENFAFFIYGGVMQNKLLNASGSEEAAVSLSGQLPAYGGGMIFRVGPSWYLRTDIGTDVAHAALMLRF